MSHTRRQLLQAVTVCIVLPSSACRGNTAGLLKDKIMQKYPMNTYAVGRFLIDCPEAAKNASMSMRIFGKEIEWKPATAAEYLTLLSMRVNILKGTNSATNFLISDEAGAVSQSRIILFEEDSTRDGFVGYEAYLYAEKVNGYFILTGSADRKKVENIIPHVNEVLNLIQPRLIDRNFTSRGACLDHAFIAGADLEWGETASIMASFNKIALGFSTQVIDKIDEGPTLLQRAETINGFPDAKLLRKKRRTIAGLHGAEFCFIDTPQGGGGYSFQWEYIGQPNSFGAPKIRVGIDTTTPISISSEELLGLWDAILESIHLRPGAV